MEVMKFVGEWFLLPVEMTNLELILYTISVLVAFMIGEFLNRICNCSKE